MVSAKYTVSDGNTSFRYWIHKHVLVAILPRYKKYKVSQSKIYAQHGKVIGNDLRKVATDSVLKVIEEEVRLILNNENKSNEYKWNVINNT